MGSPVFDYVQCADFDNRLFCLVFVPQEEIYLDFADGTFFDFGSLELYFTVLSHYAFGSYGHFFDYFRVRDYACVSEFVADDFAYSINDCNNRGNCIRSFCMDSCYDSAGVFL